MSRQYYEPNPNYFPMQEHIKELEAENARLKAEVEMWKLRSDNWQKFCQLTRPEMTDEVDRLKAEVENSNRINTELLLLSNQQASEVRRLNAEVERLRKAGDAIIEWFGVNDYSHKVIKDWNKAKEGKPSV